MGQPDENPFGTADIAESIRVLVLNHFTNELCAAFAEPVEHIAEAAIQVLGDPELSRRMVEEGLAHIRLFDWDEIAQQTLDLYEGLVAATDQA